ncbi:MAG: caspase family protein [Pseudomonadota bacterium]
MKSWSLSVALLLSVAGARAEPLPSTPLLRIDTGRHTAFIHALVLDEKAGKAYSASEDKTIRVWRITDGRLLDTFRVPAGLQAEGQLYALALSPDGHTLAAAGWTCWEVEHAACIYLLDAQSGELRGRIAGLPEVVATLGFSPDGQHIAAGMMGTAGLEVFRLKDRLRVAADHDYRGKLLELDFGPQGRLSTSSLDGFIRVYDSSFKLAGRVNAGLAGHEPFGVRYSPDGRYVAVGFNDVARISILDAADLRVLRTLELNGALAPRNLTRVAWNHASISLVATGEPIGSQNTGVFRWVLTEPGPPTHLALAHERIGDLAVTHDDCVLFAAEDPALGLIDKAGRRRYLLLSGVPDYRAAQQSLKVSRDGATIEIALANQPGALRRFSLLRGEFTRPLAPDPALNAPTIEARGWKISRAKTGAAFTINGHAPSLDPFESPRAYALAPRAALMVLGTEWALRAIDPQGATRWSVHMPTVVRAVNVSADERVLLVVLGDGTLHWYSLQGTLLASAFLHSNGSDWAAWTPQGFYAASPYGDRFVGWLLNRGVDVSPDFFRAVQLERTMYRPDLLSAPFRGAPLPVSALADNAPPRVSVEVLSSTPTTRRIRVRAQSSHLPMKDLSAYVNDIPILPAAGRALGAGESREFVRELVVPVSEADNTLRIEVFNGSGFGEAEKFVSGEPRAAAAGDLYLLAVGVNQFSGLGADLALNFSARDAQEFARVMAAAGKGQFQRVHAQTLSDGGEPPTRAGILRALNALKVAKGVDTVVVFLASHGISDAAGNYYFVPRDAQRADVDALLDGRTLPAISSLVSWQDVSEALRNTAGRRLLVVDTCQARQISGHFADSPLLKRSASSRMAFILASKGDEESQEYETGRHGLFTYGLLEGLTPGITVAEWFARAASTVDRLRDRRIGPQTPQLIAPESLANLQLIKSADEVRGR